MIRPLLKEESNKMYPKVLSPSNRRLLKETLVEKFGYMLGPLNV